MIHCYSCGSDLPDNIIYCLHCGNRLDETPTVVFPSRSAKKPIGGRKVLAAIAGVIVGLVILMKIVLYNVDRIPQFPVDPLNNRPAANLATAASPPRTAMPDRQPVQMPRVEQQPIEPSVSFPTPSNEADRRNAANAARQARRWQQQQYGNTASNNVRPANYPPMQYAPPIPRNARAMCNDGQYSTWQGDASTTCFFHRGVRYWINTQPASNAANMKK